MSEMEKVISSLAEQCRSADNQSDSGKTIAEDLTPFVAIGEEEGLICRLPDLQGPPPSQLIGCKSCDVLSPNQTGSGDELLVTIGSSGIEVTSNCSSTRNPDECLRHESEMQQSSHEVNVSVTAPPTMGPSVFTTGKAILLGDTKKTNLLPSKQGRIISSTSFASPPIVYSNSQTKISSRGVKSELPLHMGVSETIDLCVKSKTNQDFGQNIIKPCSPVFVEEPASSRSKLCLSVDSRHEVFTAGEVIAGSSDLYCLTNDMLPAEGISKDKIRESQVGVETSRNEYKISTDYISEFQRYVSKHDESIGNSSRYVPRHFKRVSKHKHTENDQDSGAKFVSTADDIDTVKITSNEKSHIESNQYSGQSGLSIPACRLVQNSIIGTLWPIDDNVDKMMSELPRYSQAPTDFTKALGLVHVTDLSCPRVTFKRSDSAPNLTCWDHTEDVGQRKVSSLDGKYIDLSTSKSPQPNTVNIFSASSHTSCDSSSLQNSDYGREQKRRGGRSNPRGRTVSRVSHRFKRSDDISADNQHCQVGGHSEQADKSADLNAAIKTTDKKRGRGSRGRGRKSRGRGHIKQSLRSSIKVVDVESSEKIDRNYEPESGLGRGTPTRQGFKQRGRRGRGGCNIAVGRVHPTIHHQNQIIDSGSILLPTVQSAFAHKLDLLEKQVKGCSSTCSPVTKDSAAGLTTPVGEGLDLFSSISTQPSMTNTQKDEVSFKQSSFYKEKSPTIQSLINKPTLLPIQTCSRPSVKAKTISTILSERDRHGEITSSAPMFETAAAPAVMKSCNGLSPVASIKTVLSAGHDKDVSGLSTIINQSSAHLKMFSSTVHIETPQNSAMQSSHNSQESNSQNTLSSSELSKRDTSSLVQTVAGSSSLLPRSNRLTVTSEGAIPKLKEYLKSKPNILKESSSTGAHTVINLTDDRNPSSMASMVTHLTSERIKPQVSLLSQTATSHNLLNDAISRIPLPVSQLSSETTATSGESQKRASNVPISLPKNMYCSSSVNSTVPLSAVVSTTQKKPQISAAEKAPTVLSLLQRKPVNQKVVHVEPTNHCQPRPALKQTDMSIGTKRPMRAHQPLQKETLRLTHLMTPPPAHTKPFPSDIFIEPAPPDCQYVQPASNMSETDGEQKVNNSTLKGEQRKDIASTINEVRDPACASAFTNNTNYPVPQATAVSNSLRNQSSLPTNRTSSDLPNRIHLADARSQKSAMPFSLMSQKEVSPMPKEHPKDDSKCLDLIQRGQISQTKTPRLTSDKKITSLAGPEKNQLSNQKQADSFRTNKSVEQTSTNDSSRAFPIKPNTVSKPEVPHTFIPNIPVVGKLVIQPAEKANEDTQGHRLPVCPHLRTCPNPAMHKPLCQHLSGVPPPAHTKVPVEKSKHKELPLDLTSQPPEIVDPGLDLSINVSNPRCSSSNEPSETSCYSDSQDEIDSSASSASIEGQQKGKNKVALHTLLSTDKLEGGVSTHGQVTAAIKEKHHKESTGYLGAAYSFAKPLINNPSKNSRLGTTSSEVGTSLEDSSPSQLKPVKKRYRKRGRFTVVKAKRRAPRDPSIPKRKYTKRAAPVHENNTVLINERPRRSTVSLGVYKRTCSCTACTNFVAPKRRRSKGSASSSSASSTPVHHPDHVIPDALFPSNSETPSSIKSDSIDESKLPVLSSDSKEDVPGESLHTSGIIKHNEKDFLKLNKAGPLEDNPAVGESKLDLITDVNLHNESDHNLQLLSEAAILASKEHGELSAICNNTVHQDKEESTTLLLVGEAPVHIKTNDIPKWIEHDHPKEKMISRLDGQSSKPYELLFDNTSVHVDNMENVLDTEATEGVIHQSMPSSVSCQGSMESTRTEYSSNEGSMFCKEINRQEGQSSKASVLSFDTASVHVDKMENVPVREAAKDSVHQSLSSSVSRQDSMESTKTEFSTTEESITCKELDRQEGQSSKVSELLFDNPSVHVDKMEKVPDREARIEYSTKGRSIPCNEQSSQSRYVQRMSSSEDPPGTSIITLMTSSSLDGNGPDGSNEIQTYCARIGNSNKSCAINRESPCQASSALQNHDELTSEALTNQNSQAEKGHEQHMELINGNECHNDGHHEKQIGVSHNSDSDSDSDFDLPSFSSYLSKVQLDNTSHAMPVIENAPTSPAELKCDEKCPSKNIIDTSNPDASKEAEKIEVTQTITENLPCSVSQKYESNDRRTVENSPNIENLMEVIEKKQAKKGMPRKRKMSVSTQLTLNKSTKSIKLTSSSAESIQCKKIKKSKMTKKKEKNKSLNLKVKGSEMKTKHPASPKTTVLRKLNGLAAQPQPKSDEIAAQNSKRQDKHRLTDMTKSDKQLSSISGPSHQKKKGNKPNIVDGKKKAFSRISKKRLNSTKASDCTLLGHLGNLSEQNQGMISNTLVTDLPERERLKSTKSPYASIGYLKMIGPELQAKKEGKGKKKEIPNMNLVTQDPMENTKPDGSSKLTVGDTLRDCNVQPITKKQKKHNSREKEVEIHLHNITEIPEGIRDNELNIIEESKKEPYQHNYIIKPCTVELEKLDILKLLKLNRKKRGPKSRMRKENGNVPTNPKVQQHFERKEVQTENLKGDKSTTIEERLNPSDQNSESSEPKHKVDKDLVSITCKKQKKKRLNPKKKLLSSLGKDPNKKKTTYPKYKDQLSDPSTQKNNSSKKKKPKLAECKQKGKQTKEISYKQKVTPSTVKGSKKRQKPVSNTRFAKANQITNLPVEKQLFELQQQHLYAEACAQPDDLQTVHFVELESVQCPSVKDGIGSNNQETINETATLENSIESESMCDQKEQYNPKKLSLAVTGSDQLVFDRLEYHQTKDHPSDHEKQLICKELDQTCNEGTTAITMDSVVEKDPISLEIDPGQRPTLTCPTFESDVESDYMDLSCENAPHTPSSHSDDNIGVLFLADASFSSDEDGSSDIHLFEDDKSACETSAERNCRQSFDISNSLEGSFVNPMSELPQDVKHYGQRRDTKRQFSETQFDISLARKDQTINIDAEKPTYVNENQLEKNSLKENANLVSKPGRWKTENGKSVSSYDMKTCYVGLNKLDQKMINPMDKHMVGVRHEQLECGPDSAKTLETQKKLKTLESLKILEKVPDGDEEIPSGSNDCQGSPETPKSPMDLTVNWHTLRKGKVFKATKSTEKDLAAAGCESTTAYSKDTAREAETAVEARVDWRTLREGNIFKATTCTEKNHNAIVNKPPSSSTSQECAEEPKAAQDGKVDWHSLREGKTFKTTKSSEKDQHRKANKSSSSGLENVQKPERVDKCPSREDTTFKGTTLSDSVTDTEQSKSSNSINEQTKLDGMGSNLDTLVNWHSIKETLSKKSKKASERMVDTKAHIPSNSTQDNERPQGIDSTFISSVNWHTLKETNILKATRLSDEAVDTDVSKPINTSDNQRNILELFQKETFGNSPIAPNKMENRLTVRALDLSEPMPLDDGEMPPLTSRHLKDKLTVDKQSPLWGYLGQVGSRNGNKKSSLNDN